MIINTLISHLVVSGLPKMLWYTFTAKAILRSYNNFSYLLIYDICRNSFIILLNYVLLIKHKLQTKKYRCIILDIISFLKVKVINVI